MHPVEIRSFHSASKADGDFVDVNEVSKSTEIEKLRADADDGIVVLFVIAHHGLGCERVTLEFEFSSERRQLRGAKRHVAQERPVWRE